MSEPRRAIVVGFRYHARYLAQLLNEHCTGWRVETYPRTRVGTLRALWALRRASAIISFGGPGPNAMLTEVARERGVAIVVIWAGSDVVTMANGAIESTTTKRCDIDNVAVAPWLVDELGELGVSATYVPVAAVQAASAPVPLPRPFRVLAYLPEPRRAFYGEGHVYAIARAMNDVEFVVIGRGGSSANAPPNVTFHGHVENVDAEIDASTVLLRLPEHDGKSMLVLESLARGRHVVWTHAFPGVHAVGDAEGALGALHALYQAHRQGTLALNEDGRAHVRAMYSRASIAQRFEGHLDELLRSRC